VRFGHAPYAAPSEEPITLSEAKSHVGVDIDAWDSDIAAAVATARSMVEGATGRMLVTQTWDGYLDAFPCGCIEVRRAPLVSVSSIVYTDPDGASQTLAADQYQVDAVGVEPRILPVPGGVWPVARYGTVNAVRVRMVLGYGAASAVPPELKSAIKLIAGTLFAYREDQVTGTIVAKSLLASNNLIARYRLPSALFAA